MTKSFRVQDRRSELSGDVHRAVQANALGESYWYDIVALAVQTDPARPESIEPAYIIAISTRAPVPLGAHISITSKPVTFMIPADAVAGLVKVMIEKLRADVAESLRVGLNGHTP
jgi:hypothetical protein